MDQFKIGRQSNWIMLQEWEDMLFLHWPVSPKWIKPYIPPGLKIDTFHGFAWISIVSFKVSKTRLRYLPKIPYLPSMLQVNVRTYVERKGVKGIYFFTVETNKLSAVIGARLATLPYFHANMWMKEENRSYHMYSSRRGLLAKWEVIYQPSGGKFTPDQSSVDYWLLERYVLWTNKNNSLYQADISHENWEVSRAKFQIQDNTLFSFLPGQDQNIEPIAHYVNFKSSVNWIPRKI